MSEHRAYRDDELPISIVGFEQVEWPWGYKFVSIDRDHILLIKPVELADHDDEAYQASLYESTPGGKHHYPNHVDAQIFTSDSDLAAALNDFLEGVSENND